MKLLRTIRLDPSDTFVFDRAAEPGEWAVPGSFMFMNADIDKLEGKARAAFRSGFLGIDSFGWSTLAQIVEVSEADRAAVIALLAQRLMAKLGAPDLAAANAAANEEITFAASLCDHADATIIALHRVQENGAIRETFRTLRANEGARPVRVFNFLEVEGEDEGPSEEVDLIGLVKDRKA